MNLDLLLARDRAIHALEKFDWQTYSSGVGFGGWDASFILGDDLDHYSIVVTYSGQDEPGCYRVSIYDETLSAEDNAGLIEQGRDTSFDTFELLLAYAEGLKERLRHWPCEVP